MFGKYNYERANQLHDAGEYDKAIPKYIKAIESGDLNADEIYFAFVFLASCCIGQGDYNSAIINLDKALEWDDEYYQTYYEYGRVYWSQDEYDSAIPYFEKAIERDSSDYLSWKLYGLSLIGLERYDESIDALSTALNLATYEDTDEVEDALNRAKVCLAYQEGEKYFEEKNFESALEMFNQALDLNDEVIDEDEEKLAEIHRMKGNCLLALKFHDEALKEFDEATSLSIDAELQVFIDLGNYYIDNKDFENADLCFSEGLKRCDEVDSGIRGEVKKQISILYSLSHAAKLWVVDDDGYGALEIIESINPHNTEAIYGKIVLKGEILYYLGRYEEAISCLKGGIDNDEYDITSYGYSYIGCSYQKMGHYETALRYIEEGIQKGTTEDSTVWVSKGECHLHLKQYGKALEAYRKALEFYEDEKSEEYTIPEIEEKIKAAKQIQAREEAEKEAKKRPTHITIQGNNAAPINIGGILATDDAIINRATIQKEEEEVITAFCPQCGCKVDAEDRFCRSCGGKLR
ncbi:MAG: tetratricopeptide repeat protein [Methanocorpusculum parvum]|nr:tetratricopeptide repeat protein [Methanocorpusculum parvum]